METPYYTLNHILKFIGDAYTRLNEKEREKFESSCISQFVNSRFDKLTKIGELAALQLSQAMKVEFEDENVSNKEIDDLRNLLGRTDNVAKKLLEKKDNLLKTMSSNDPLILELRNIAQ